MGMTYGCARCHDHKFDPILHKDYYRLQAFFASITRTMTTLACSTGDEVAAVPAAVRRVGRARPATSATRCKRCWSRSRKARRN